MTCQNFVCILRCQHFLVNIYLEIHPTQMSNHYKLSPSLLGGFPFLPLFMFDNHDKNHWFDQLQEVHWKGCSLRTSLPTGARGGVKLHGSTPKTLKHRKNLPKRLPTESFFGDHMFFFGLNPAPFPSIIVFFVVCFAKKDPSNGRGTFFFPPVGLLGRSPRCRRPWRFCVASKTGMLHTMGSASRTRR